MQGFIVTISDSNQFVYAIDDEGNDVEGEQYYEDFFCHLSNIILVYKSRPASVRSIVS